MEHLKDIPIFYSVCPFHISVELFEHQFAILCVHPIENLYCHYLKVIEEGMNNHNFH